MNSIGTIRVFRCLYGPNTGFLQGFQLDLGCDIGFSILFCSCRRDDSYFSQCLARFSGTANAKKLSKTVNTHNSSRLLVSYPVKVQFVVMLQHAPEPCSEY